MKTFLLSLAIFLLAFSLRYANYTLHAPFDWDQNRDYAEVVKIASGELVILGPIAKGVGGFYLGSLYYYLLYPAYFFMQGSLAALPLTSLLLDALMAGLIYLLLHKSMGKSGAFLLALLWTFSVFMISASRVSWNVALVPLWSLLMLYSFHAAIKQHSAPHLYLLGFLFGLSFHIHVAAIPVIPIFILLFVRRLRFPLSTWLKAAALAVLPLVPLILFDLKHNFLNTRLLIFQTYTHLAVKTPLSLMLPMALIKLGKLVNGIVFAHFADQLILGIIILLFAVRSFLFDHRLLLRLAGAGVITAFVLVLALRDYGFPEYYYGPSYLPICLIVIALITDAASFLGKLKSFALALIIIPVLLLNYQTYKKATPSGLSLGIKTAIVNSLKDYPQPIDVSLKFDPGRDGGIGYLIKQSGVQLDPDSRIRIILTDKIRPPAYIDGELAEDQLILGDIKTALYIVQ